MDFKANRAHLYSNLLSTEMDGRVVPIEKAVLLGGKAEADLSAPVA